MPQSSSSTSPQATAPPNPTRFTIINITSSSGRVIYDLSIPLDRIDPITSTCRRVVTTVSYLGKCVWNTVRSLNALISTTSVVRRGWKIMTTITETNTTTTTTTTTTTSAQASDEDCVGFVESTNHNGNAGCTAISAPVDNDDDDDDDDDDAAITTTPNTVRRNNTTTNINRTLSLGHDPPTPQRQNHTPPHNNNNNHNHNQNHKQQQQQQRPHHIQLHQPHPVRRRRRRIPTRITPRDLSSPTSPFAQQRRQYFLLPNLCIRSLYRQHLTHSGTLSPAERCCNVGEMETTGFYLGVPSEIRSRIMAGSLRGFYSSGASVDRERRTVVPVRALELRRYYDYDGDEEEEEEEEEEGGGGGGQEEREEDTEENGVEKIREKRCRRRKRKWSTLREVWSVDDVSDEYEYESENGATEGEEVDMDWAVKTEEEWLYGEFEDGEDREDANNREREDETD